MTNLTPSPSPSPRPSAFFAAPRVSDSETRLHRLTPISGAFRPSFVDSVSLASPALKRADPHPQPQQFTPGPSIAGARGLLASHLPAAQRLHFADSSHLRVDTPQAPPNALRFDIPPPFRYHPTNYRRRRRALRPPPLLCARRR